MHKGEYHQHNDRQGSERLHSIAIGSVFLLSTPVTRERKRPGLRFFSYTTPSAQRKSARGKALVRPTRAQRQAGAPRYIMRGRSLLAAGKRCRLQPVLEMIEERARASTEVVGVPDGTADRRRDHWWHGAAAGNSADCAARASYPRDSSRPGNTCTGVRLGTALAEKDKTPCAADRAVLLPQQQRPFAAARADD